MIADADDNRPRVRFGFGLATIPACAAVLTLFAVFWGTPFRIEGDIAYVAKAAQQHVAYNISFNQLRLVDPHDLSRDIDTWIFWWPPFIHSCFIALLNVGLTLASAARILMLMAAVIGTIGWAMVSMRLFSKRLALLLSGAPSLLYVLNNEMFDQFASGDPFVFAAAPWLLFIVLDLHQRPGRWQSHFAFVSLGLACGALYWVKFSSLFISASVLLSSALLLASTGRFCHQITKLALLGFGCLLPIALLWTLNHSRGGDFLESSVASATHFGDLPDAFVRAVAMTILPVDNGIERFAPGSVSSLTLRIIGLLLALVVAIGAWRGYGRSVGILTTLIAAIPIAALGYLTHATGYHFLLDASRHAGPYWIFLQLVLIGVLARDVRLRIPKEAMIRATATAGTAVLLAFVAYGPYVALRGAISRSNSDRDALTGLYDPTLSLTRSAAIADAIRAQLKPDDVVVPATYWLGMETWLAFDQRLLPLTNFYHPLVATHGRDGAAYDADTSFRSSRPVRIVVIVADPFLRPDMLETIKRIKRRFPQARRWDELNLPERTATSVWTAVLSDTQ